MLPYMSPILGTARWLVILLFCLSSIVGLGAAAFDDQQQTKAKGPSSLLPASASANSTAKLARRPFQCGADTPDPEVLATIARLHDESLNVGSPAARAARKLRNERRQTASINIDTYLHLVSSVERNGTYTAYQMQKQFNRLAGAFARYNIFFTLRGIGYVVNDAWATGADESGMRRALRQGTYRSLNIYFHTSLEMDVLGWCSVPGPISSSAATNPGAYALDGCSVAAGTVPGGDIYGYDEGQTAVHETGHWLGLLHVFQGYSCSGPGDYIADTPMQSQSTDGCPVDPPKDSCPTRPGIDFIQNFMDYSYDSW